MKLESQPKLMLEQIYTHRPERETSARYAARMQGDSQGQTTMFDAFKATKYFGELDGLRAVSILLVITIHSKVYPLHALHGYNGVTIFFVLSGFLITTLLLREHAKNGRVAIGGFYIRRAFRILPLYYLALGLTTAAVAVGFGTNPESYWPRLVYFLTYMNELAPAGTFGHSWSLAIEEKFYLVWPLLAFVVPALWKWRAWTAGVLLAATSVVGLVLPAGYIGIYAPIVAGCVIAIAMDSPRSYAFVRRMASPLAGVALAVVAVVVLLLSANGGPNQVPFGLAFAALLPFLLIGPHWSRRWLRWKPLVFIGQRAYAVYLFHPLVGSVVEAVVPEPLEGAWAVVHMVLMLALTLLLADLLFRFFERPLIKVGHRLAGKKKEPRALPAVTS